MDKKQLRKTIADELHKRVIKNFTRRKVITGDIGETYAMDIVDMSKLEEYNKGFKYMLTMIDITSKFAWAVPMKNKDAKATFEAYKSTKAPIPKKLWVDEGGEFYNKLFNAYCKKNKIEMYSTHGEHKSAIIERFNRTLKEKMYKMFDVDDNSDWVSKIDELIDEYNHTKHRTLGMTPIQAVKDGIATPTWEEAKEIKKEKAKPIKAKFKVGDRVRIARTKGTFEKGYTAKWSYEIYTIYKIFDSKPPTYELMDDDKDKIKGKFYEQEIQKTKQGKEYLIDKVIKERTKGGKKEYFVKWLGYPDKFNSWVDESQFLKEK